MDVTKSTAQEKIFVGLSGVYAVIGGIPENGPINETESIPAGGYKTGDCIQVPVRRDGGFTYTGGTPSVERFNIHGMVGAYSARITPGDSEVSLEIPTYQTQILQFCGFEAKDVTKVINGRRFVGKAYSESPKTLTLGLIGFNDEDNKVMFLKKVKVQASLNFDGADTAKPVSVVMTGASLAGGADDAIGFLEEDDSSSSI